jgi:hypothetical protein
VTKEEQALEALEAQRQDLLAALRKPMPSTPPGPLPPPPDELGREIEELHARHVRIHGTARADLARWKGLLALADFMRRCEERRKQRALSEALEALERAQLAEVGEARWLRVACWIGRRVDDAYARVAHRSRVASRVDFSPDPTRAQYGEALEPTDLSNEEEEEIKW